MKQLQDESGRLKQLVAELGLDKAMLQDVLRKSREPSRLRPLVDFLHDKYRASERHACRVLRLVRGNLSLQEPPEGMDGAAGAYPGDCAELGAFRIPEDSGSSEA